MSEFQEYPMPTGEIWKERARKFRELQESNRYWLARSCKHCTNLADSFNRWTDTYCHARKKIIASLDGDCLGECVGCELYEKRDAK